MKESDKKATEWQQKYEGILSPFILPPFFDICNGHSDFIFKTVEKKTAAECREKMKSQTTRFRQNFESFKAMKSELEELKNLKLLLRFPLSLLLSPLLVLLWLGMEKRSWKKEWERSGKRR